MASGKLNRIWMLDGSVRMGRKSAIYHCRPFGGLPVPQLRCILFGRVAVVEFLLVYERAGRLRSQFSGGEPAVPGVLEARARFGDSSLADLYDPLTMPPELVKAHQTLDKAVDKCYRGTGFGSETERLEYLFGLYNEYTSPLIGAEAKKKGKKKG